MVIARQEHNVTVWARNLKRTRWAWSCTCGTRYSEDLPSHGAARSEAHAHAARQGRAA